MKASGTKYTHTFIWHYLLKSVWIATYLLVPWILVWKPFPFTFSICSTSNYSFSSFSQPDYLSMQHENSNNISENNGNFYWCNHKFKKGSKVKCLQKESKYTKAWGRWGALGVQFVQAAIGVVLTSPLRVCKSSDSAMNRAPRIKRQTYRNPKHKILTKQIVKKIYI